MIFYIYRYFIQKNMIKIYEIYVSTTGSQLQIIYICWFRENIQHSMLDNHNYNNLSIENYKREILPTFMLALHVYFTHSLTLVYLKVIVDNQS